MSLPKLNVPTYELTLPSTEQKVKYRPFLVKEHKVLLMLKDSTDDDSINAIQEIVEACTFGTLNAKELPSFDLEYIFLKLREKSLGESTDLLVNCNCGFKIPYEMNLSTLEVKKDPSHSNKIMLNDTIGVEMQYPKISQTIPIYFNTTEEKVMNMIISSIKAVYTADGEYHEVNVDNKEEAIEFVNSMTKEQFDKIENFFVTMPKLVHEIEAKCPSCGEVNHATLEGLQNFFA